MLKATTSCPDIGVLQGIGVRTAHCKWLTSPLEEVRTVICGRAHHHPMLNTTGSCSDLGVLQGIVGQVRTQIWNYHQSISMHFATTE